MGVITVDLALILASVPFLYFAVLLVLRRPQAARDVPVVPAALLEREKLAAIAPTLSGYNKLQIAAAVLYIVSVVGFLVARTFRAHSLDDPTTSVPTHEQLYCAVAASLAGKLGLVALARELNAKDPAFAGPSMELRLGWVLLAAVAAVTLHPALEEYLMRDGGPNSAFERDAWYTTLGLGLVTAGAMLLAPFRWMEYQELREYQFGPHAAGGLGSRLSANATEMRTPQGSRAAPVAGGYSVSSLWRSGVGDESKGDDLYAPLLGEDEGDAGRTPRYSPELYTTPLGYLTFSWLNPIVRTGYRRALKQEDLYALHPEERAPVLAEELQRTWGAEVLAAETKNLEDPEGKRKRPSLSRAMWTSFGSTFVVACIFKTLYDTLLFVGPQLLNRVISFIEDSNDDSVDTPPLWHGYLLVGLMFTTNLLQSVVLHQYFHRAYRTGMRLKSAVVSLVFSKAMRINAGAVEADDVGAGKKGKDGKKQDQGAEGSGSPEDESKAELEKPLLRDAKAAAKAKAENGNAKGTAGDDGDDAEDVSDQAKATKKSSGEIVNLMSVDAQRMQDLMSYFAMLISAPYQITLSLVFLWNEIGASVFAGVGVMVLIVPLTGFVASKSRQLQKGLMRVKDERIKVTNEVLAGIKILKLYAWERPFGEKIDGIRERELRSLWKYMLWSLLSRFLWTVVPILVSVAAFSAYTLSGGVLTPAKAFTALALFNILRFPLAMFPMMVSYTVEASLSVSRLRSFLTTQEVSLLPPLSGPPLTPSSTTLARDGSRRESGESYEVKPGLTLLDARDAELRWSDGTPLLERVNLQVASGELCAVVGATGAGKSGLLYSFIGDLEPSFGQVTTSGRIAYVAQTAWIQNGTLRENVLFGAPYDPVWYTRVLFACALLPDLETLAAGDATEIGEKGINLSGGQKQRVALARAVYSDSDVYLLDDCLSAVDSQVAAHIVEHCIRGLLAPKAIVLVTHNMHTLAFAHRVVLLERRGGQEGRAAANGGANGDANGAENGNSHGDENGGGANGYDHSDAPQELNLGSVVAYSGDFEGFLASGHPFAKLVDATAAHAGDDDAADAEARAQLDIKVHQDVISKGERERAGKLIDQEAVAVGSVGGEVYYGYMLAAGGFWFCMLMPLGLVVYQGFLIGTNYWLSYWSDHNDSVSSGEGLAVYSALSAGGALATLLTLLIVTITSVAAARVFHRQLMAAMLRAPMAFFDTTPLGRILNRFSKDTYTIDEQLMSAIYSWMSTLVSVVGIVIVISFATPFFLLCLLPLGAFYYYTQNYYIPTSRELKRLDSVSRSPIFSAFGEVLEGVSTIRAFRAESRFVSDEYTKLDANLQAYYLYVASNRWLAMRLEFVGTCIVTFAALLAVVGRNSIPAGLAALSISYALQVTQSLNWMVRMTSDRESYIVSVERVQEYTDVPPEAAAVTEAGRRPAASWPHDGHLTISNLQLRYRPGLPLVLQGLSVDILPGQRVGIVGRTGAGKSSMLIALLRLVEADAGSIRLDGVEMRDLGLDDVRGRVSIIPQDPVLFTGSVRSNLDPFGRAEDPELWSALDRAHLGDHIRMLPFQLGAEVEEGGRNFSLGERQMLCFARALIRRSKLLLLDEATSAIDPATDALIQTTLRQEFAGVTLLTIAHRIDTILDYDRILVLGEGKVLEDGSADELLKDSDSEFTKIYEAHRQGMA